MHFIGKPRLVAIDDVTLEAELTPHMLFVRNEDKPGFIGALGMLLGEAGVNIATFNLGRVSANDDGIALVGVDQAPDAPLLAKIQALPHVKEARALVF